MSLQNRCGLKRLPKNSGRVWFCIPGSGAEWWDLCERDIVIGWGEIGDLRKIATKQKMGRRIAREWGEAGSHTNDALACWQFSREMAVGDVVVANKGLHSILGVGIVSGGYRYDGRFSGTTRNFRRVKWVVRRPRGDGVVTSNLFFKKTLTEVTGDYERIRKALNAVGYSWTIGDASTDRCVRRSYDSAIRDCEELACKLRKMSHVQVQSEAVRRVGQDKLRRLLMVERGGKCQVSGIGKPQLLVVSHIVEWSKCHAGEHLDTDNVLLLAANYDAVFDRHYVSFGPDTGKLLKSSRITWNELRRLGIQKNARLSKPTETQAGYLKRHLAVMRAKDRIKLGASKGPQWWSKSVGVARRNGR